MFKSDFNFVYNIKQNDEANKDVYFVLRHSVLGCPPQNMGVSYTFFHSVPNSFPVFVVFDSKRKSVRGADLLS